MTTARRWILAAAGLALPVAAACVDESAGPTPVTGRAGLRVGMDFVALGLPGGEAAVTAGVVDLDTVNNPIDLFGRATGTAAETWPSPRYADTYDLGTDFGRKTKVAPRQWIAGFVPDDPRKPFLVQNSNWADSYLDNVDHIRFWSPSSSVGADCPSGPCWTYSSDYDYIGPDDSWFAVGLVRYAVKVNGLVDHLEILVNNGVVEEPDSLIPLGGTPGGYPDVQSDHWMYNGNDCLPVPPNANPFILGHFKTGPTVDPNDPGADFNGETDADFCFYSNGVWSDDGVTSGTQPFAPNSFTSFDLPQYNYLVIWSYDKATGQVKYDEPWVRAQIGVDLDLNGNPIPHAFAPFPTAPGREQSEFASFEDFLADPRVAGGATVVTLTLENLKELAGGAEYQVWLYDEVEGELVRVEARYVRQRPDTTGVDELGEPIVVWVDEGDTATVPSFNGAAGRRHIVQLRNRDLQPLGIRMNRFTHLVLTIGSGADASPLEAPAPVWYKFVDQAGTRDNFFDNQVFLSGPSRFVFRADWVPLDLAWRPVGGGNVEFMSTVGFSVSLSRLTRPPLGYYYAVWLWNEETGAALSVGPITSPPPEFASLRDADVQTGPVVTETEILESVTWAEWAALGADFRNYTHVLVTLEPKDGVPDVPAPTVLLRAPVPRDLDKLPREREAS